MSSNHMPGTPGGSDIRRKPSYSEVDRSANRPAPINTDLARTTHAAANNPPTTASSSLFSAGYAALGTGSTAPGTASTAPTPLFSPSIWSRQDAQSATIPHKLSWESSMNAGAKTYAGAANGRAEQLLNMKTPSPSSAIGLGLHFGNMNGGHQDIKLDSNSLPKTPVETTTPAHSKIAAIGTPYKYKEHDVTDAQTRPFSREGGVSLSNTAPLMQKPFYGPAYVSPYTDTHAHSATHANAITARAIGANGEIVAMNGATQVSSSPQQVIRVVCPEERLNGDGVSTSGPGNLFSGFFDTGDSGPSEVSDISDHPEADDRDAGIKAPMVAEEPHPKNFARIQFDDSVLMVTAFPGAYEVCSSINPSHYSMGYGSRAVSIKTDFVENIHWSIQSGSWGAMEKVGERIMALWDRRVGKDDKILLVFSLNGQKSYCGMAEMSGPWKAAGENIEGFKIKGDGSSRTWGTIAVTWIYCKNVSYNWFRDIRNPTNGQDVVNMWNGMHFPSEIARKVVELFVSRPHFTNVICWRSDDSYNPYKAIVDAGQIDPTASDGKKLRELPRPRMLENGRAAGNDQGRGHNGGQGGYLSRGQALSMTNWRQPQARPQQAHGTGVAAITTGRGDFNEVASYTAASTTPPNLDGNASPGLHHPQVVPCVVDQFGNYVPVTPGGGMSKHTMASDHNSLIAQTPRAVTPSFDKRQSPGGTPARGGASSYRSGVWSSNQTTRGNAGGVDTPRGGARITPTPHTHKPQSLVGLVDPQIRRMKSDMGLEDPFGTPCNVAETNAMKRTVHQSRTPHPLPSKVTASFQRAASSANFVPMHSGSQAPAAINAVIQGPPSNGATATYGNAAAHPHTPGHGGGVTLAPPTPSRSVDITPSRLPAQLQAEQQSMQGPATPTNHQIFPIPINAAHEPKSAETTPDVARLQMEYLQQYHAELAIKRQMTGLMLKNAGVTVPEDAKYAQVANQKGD